MLNTLAITGLGLGLELCLGLVAAVILAGRLPAQGLIRALLLIPLGVPTIVSASAMRSVFGTVGYLNEVLYRLGVIALPIDWTGDRWLALLTIAAADAWKVTPMVMLILLAGLQAIPRDVYEAARVDGASRLGTYRSITLPLLRRAALIAALINLMNVFNSFPIIWEMTGGGPGYETSTTTVFMYILKQSNIGEAGAMSVVNFGIVIVIVLAFLRASRWKSEVN